MTYHTLSELPQIQITGRTAPGRAPLALFWAGSGLCFNFAGTELWLDVEADYRFYEPWLAVEMNGQRIIRLALVPGRQWVCISRSCDPDCACHFEIYKDTQPMWNDPRHQLLIHGLRFTGKCLPPPAKKWRLEFIGDSITSGEGLAGICPGKGNWGSLYLTVEGSFAKRTAAALNADFRLISQCGWGVACAWDNDPTHVLTRDYNHVCGPADGAQNRLLGAHTPCDFAVWQADAVIINLGSNDASAFVHPAWRGADGTAFKMETLPDGSAAPHALSVLRAAAVNLLRMVRRCHTRAQLVWAYGMLDTTLGSAFKTALKDYRAQTGDSKVSFCPLPATKPGEYGAHLHPGLAAHRAAATCLTKHLSTLL